MKKYICLLMAVAFLLTGCGGSTPTETEAPVTELSAMTEPTTEHTTVPTEPKTFFEEQGFEFWEGFEVYDTLDEEGNRDGGLFAEANILDSTECKVTIASENREETRYCLADTKVDVWVDEYTLAEFDEECKEKNWGAVNIKNASDSLYKAFKEEDNSLTKEAWLDQYQDYKVVYCHLHRLIKTSEMCKTINDEVSSYTTHPWSVAILDCESGKFYDLVSEDYLGTAEKLFPDADSEKMVLFDASYEWRQNDWFSDFYLSENIFLMVPEKYDRVAFVLPAIEEKRTLKDLEEAQNKYDTIFDSAWEEKTFEEYKGNMKHYFLSPFHH